jgi:pimeloyl-ACP methyl ester carboxylesterase
MDRFGTRIEKLRTEARYAWRQFRSQIPLSPMEEQSKPVATSDWLGAIVRPLHGMAEWSAAGLGDGIGLLVVTVPNNSPAERAGLKVSDVLLEIEGQAINSLSALDSVAGKPGVGSLVIYRNQNRQILFLTPRLNYGDAKVDEWNGFVRQNFTVDGCPSWVAEPPTPLPGNPWVWCMEFPDAFPESCAEFALLNLGFHLAHIQVGNTFGCPAALKHFDAFYSEMRKAGFKSKVILIGISRGGLYAYNWAALNAEKVSVIYGDAPVGDFKSWPAGKGIGRGSPKDWDALLKCYGFQSEAEALAYKGNPVDQLEPLARGKVALINVVGDDDMTVPVQENTEIVQQRYEALGGTIQVIHKPGVDHHPHGLADVTPVVNFIKKNAL